MGIRDDAQRIWQEAIASVQPDWAVRLALARREFPNRVHVVAIGKAAWRMAAAASEALGERIRGGVVITKYRHSEGPIGNLQIYEAGHPVPDESTYRATAAALEAVSGLDGDDLVLFLVSGGGSALFEQPLTSDMADITRQLLACGADIVEINTIRKRLSAVKGGRFAQRCRPARIYAVVLSDVLGDRLDMIASGPACPDSSTAEQAMAIVEKYDLRLSEQALSCLRRETPKALDNVETVVVGSVRQLCEAARDAAACLGYRPVVLTDRLCCHARDAGSFLASIAQTHAAGRESLAFLAGGETVVQVTGDGLGGRSQELALAAAEGIDGLEDTAVFAFGSDGTDGPTDAAGGFVDQDTAGVLRAQGISLSDALRRNDAYHALAACGGLIVTGPTGTNVNDLAVVLIRRDPSSAAPQ